MTQTTRRTFLGTLGSLLAFPAGADVLRGLSQEESDRLGLGRFDALAGVLQEVPADRLQQQLIERLRRGLALEDLVAAACLANARAFGGHDYEGYHCQMALLPAFEMARELEGEERWLPVLKVVHRQARRIEATGGRNDALLELESTPLLSEEDVRAELQEGLRERDVARMERAFHGRCAGSATAGLHDVQTILRETLDVHRIVLTWRSWDALQLTGEEHAETLLRQSLRWFVDAEGRRVDRRRPTPPLRTLLPGLIAGAGLERGGKQDRPVGDDELGELAATIFAADADDAAAAMADALGAGWNHEDAGEALTLAANTLLLNDPGRASADGSDKPRGSVHGASVGVHASDAARAWRNLASVSDEANAAANLIAGAYHTAGQSHRVGTAPFPYAQEMDAYERCKPEQLVRALRSALEQNDQAKAAAAVASAQQKDMDPEALFAVLLNASLEADGALHAEKYYRTVREDFASSRPRHRWRHLIALARVAASQVGFEAPGLREARETLNG